MDNRIEICQRWYSIEQVAGALGVHTRTVRRWCAAGKMPHSRIGGRLIRISDSHLSHFLKAASTATAQVNA